MKGNISMVKPFGFLMLVVLFASFMAAINISVVKAQPHLVINEFIVQVDEYVELYNPTGSSIDLSKWILSDRPLFSAYWPGGESNITLSGTIAPGGYVVFDVTVTMALADEPGDDLYLYDNTSGLILDEASALTYLIDKVAWGTYGGAPDPPMNNSTARAPNGQDTDDDAADWTIDLTPTMGSANDAAPADLCKGPIVINEVLANPSGVPEFIELYNNATSGSVDISGWWLSDGEGIYVIPTGTISAGSFWFTNSTYWVGTGFSLDNSGDNVYLFNSTGHRLDQMGWSSDHGDGTSVARFFNGVGKCYAYNDATLVENGWAEETRRNGSPGSTNYGTHIWVSFYASPSTVRMFRSNYTLVNAVIANMINATTINVNLTLALPAPNVTITDPITNQTEVPLGDLAAYETRRVVWNVTVNVEGQHFLNLSVDAEVEPDPRNATTSILALPRVDIVFDDSHYIYYGWYYMDETFIPLLQNFGYVYRNPFTITDELLKDVKLLVLPAIQSDYVANETEVIKNYIDNGGSVLILGYAYWAGGTFRTWEIQNNITSAYGINYTATHIYDNNDNTGTPPGPGYSHWTVCKTWADNPIANNLTYNVQKVSTSRASTLKIDETKGVKPIGTGDTDPGTNKTVAKNATGYVVAEGTDVIVHAAVETSGGGRIFATGSATIFSDAPYYILYGEGVQFARNVLAWLMRLSTGQANFSLSTMYNVTLKANLNLKAPGANLVAQFHTYSGVYQGEVTVWSDSPPTTVTLTLNLTVGLPVEIVTLVLTDAEGNIWGAIIRLVVRRSDLMARISWLDWAWTMGWLPKPTIFLEIIDIDMQWPYAPP